MKINIDCLIYLKLNCSSDFCFVKVNETFLFLIIKLFLISWSQVRLGADVEWLPPGWELGWDKNRLPVKSQIVPRTVSIQQNQTLDSHWLVRWWGKCNIVIIINNNTIWPTVLCLQITIDCSIYLKLNYSINFCFSKMKWNISCFN